MNRRSFFRSLAATALVAVATQTRLANRVIEVVADPVTAGQRYADALAAALIETKETLAANILNRCFDENFNPTPYARALLADERLSADEEGQPIAGYG